MSRWFRHYAGMMRDEKLVRVAVKAKQPVERVVWVWGAILESAAEINDGGRHEFDAGEAAYFLRCDESELAGILVELEACGRLAGALVVRWADRQFDSDSSKERQRRYRERRQAGNGVQERHDHVGKASGDVTPPSRYGRVALQETDTELPDASASGADAPTDPRSELFGEGSKIVQRWTGKGDQAARSFIGKLLKAASDDCVMVLDKIRTAERDRMADPVAWVVAACTPKATAPPPSRPRNAGEAARQELRKMGLMHDAANEDDGRMGQGQRGEHFAGSGIARRIAFAAGG